MVATIVLNQSNLLPNGNNNTFIYKFPNSVAFPNHEIAVQSINMYYSWSNINPAPLNNTTFFILGQLAPLPRHIPSPFPQDYMKLLTSTLTFNL